MHTADPCVFTKIKLNILLFNSLNQTTTSFRLISLFLFQLCNNVKFDRVYLTLIIKRCISFRYGFFEAILIISSSANYSLNLNFYKNSRSLVLV